MSLVLAWVEHLCLLPAKETERDFQKMVRKRDWDRIPDLSMRTPFHTGLVSMWIKTDATVKLVTGWNGAKEELEQFCYFAVEYAGDVEQPLRTGQVDRFYHPFARPFLAGSVGRISSPWHIPEAS